MIGKTLIQGKFSEEKRQMAKSLYKAQFTDKLPLGGIATGHIDLCCDGTITSDASTFFAVKAEKDGELFDARLLSGSKNGLWTVPCFDNTSAVSYFPFTELFFSDSSFPFEIKMLAFSPFIPLNDTDSGIPGVLFDFEITNKSDQQLDFSLALVSENLNKEPYNRMGCSDSGEAYIHLSGLCENSKNSCIATNGKNISFCEYTRQDGFWQNFTKNSTLDNKTRQECPDDYAGGAICTHSCLGANQTLSVSFCLSWYSPQNELSRNYYAQYFESALECCSYLFRQKERLYRGSMEFCENIMGATLPAKTLEEVNLDLFTFTGKENIRLDDGTLVSKEKQEFSDMYGFINRSDITASLFPCLEYSKTQHFYKTASYESASENTLLFAILSSYRKYVLCADEDALIEDWYYITKCMERLFGEDGKNDVKAPVHLTSAAVMSAAKMAEIVRDKKRHEMYLPILEELPVSQIPMNLPKGYAKINEATGFIYRADVKHIGFCPVTDGCPLDIGDTFRCFFATPSGYGYVEEGIDYIEINLLHGSVTVRSFDVPRTPRLVQYGGRNWKFENHNLTAVLDSDLEVTPHKKLTVFIDVKQ